MSLLARSKEVGPRQWFGIIGGCAFPLRVRHERCQCVIRHAELAGRFAGQDDPSVRFRSAMTLHAEPVEHGLHQQRIAQRLGAVGTRCDARRRSLRAIASDCESGALERCSWQPIQLACSPGCR